MRAFALYMNGKKMGTAGVGDDGVLSAIITWVGSTSRASVAKRKRPVEKVGVVVGGLITATDEHLRWHQRSLRVGDEVTVG